MLPPGTLSSAFKVYWDEMKNCRDAKAYWALLHVTVCLPDICAALQSPYGETKRENKKLYIDWVDKFLKHPMLSGEEMYCMRCKLLHQGHSKTGKPAIRYFGFAYGQPSDTGFIDHNRVDVDKVLHVDVGTLADEIRQAVERWFIKIEGDPASTATLRVEKNLKSLVRVHPVCMPGFPTQSVTSSKTY